jgi:hypothetical protein
MPKSGKEFNIKNFFKGESHEKVGEIRIWDNLGPN